MNMLIDPLPTSTEIDGAEYEIDIRHTTAIRFEQMILDGNQENLAERALQLFFPTGVPPNQEAALDAIVWFYRGNPKKGKGKSSSKKAIYSFEHDAGMIITAFMADYSIDLTKEILHWWVFLDLFAGLRVDNQICKVMGYRSTDIRKLKGEQKRFYQQMQKLYAIPAPKIEQEKMDAVTNALLNDGNVSEMLA